MLPLLLTDCANRSIAACAQAICSGEDESAWAGLLDCLEEKGEPRMFEVGECYMVKTPTIYYLGRVRKASYTFVELEHVTEVYDTGETSKCWASGKPNNIENYPKTETVIIPLSSVIAAPSWHKPLPND